MMVLSGLSLQGSAHEHSQEFEFGAAQNRKVKSHGRYVSADENFSERSPRVLNNLGLFGVWRQISKRSG